MTVRLLQILIAALLLPKALPAVRTVHVFVALCDNEHQGIVPVSEALGNGLDPAGNLYWGAMYGVRTFLDRSSEWELLKDRPVSAAPVLESLLFRHKATGAMLLAEAYDGAQMRRCVTDFLNAAAGSGARRIRSGDVLAEFGGGADLVVFAGHDGLMDFSLREGEIRLPAADHRGQAIVLCCYSETYFGEHLRAANTELLVGTRGLMAPEAYVLHAALEAWLKDGDAGAMRNAAAQAYHTYQKCGLRAARSLFHAP